MLTDEEVKPIHGDRAILADAIDRMDGRVNFSTVVEYNNREYEVIIVDYKREER